MSTRRDGTEARRKPDSESAVPRVLVPSLRHVNRHAAWCSNYEFEDVIAAVDDVDLLVLEPGRQSDLRHRASRSLAWRAVSMRLNPGLQSVSLQREYDLLFFACMNPLDLLYLNALRGWRERCRVKVCFLVEFYAGWAREYAHFLELLRGFDHVALCFSGSVDVVAQAAGVPTSHVPLAADVRRFTPLPRSPPRVIDVLSVGRRSEALHEALLKVANADERYYVHDTLPSPLVRPSKPEEHRTLYANSAKRCRLFVAFPAKFGDDETHGQSEVGARYFEGAAAGAVLLGEAPTVPAFRRHFPWADAVIQPRSDGSDLKDLLAHMDAHPAEYGRMGARNATEALRRHDWGHRWQSILALAGLPPRPALGDRLRDLETLARAGTEGVQ